jgi:hypothetical protein
LGARCGLRWWPAAAVPAGPPPPPDYQCASCRPLKMRLQPSLPLRPMAGTRFGERVSRAITTTSQGEQIVGSNLRHVVENVLSASVLVRFRREFRQSKIQACNVHGTIKKNGKCICAGIVRNRLPYGYPIGGPYHGTRTLQSSCARPFCDAPTTK